MKSRSLLFSLVIFFVSCSEKSKEMPSRSSHEPQAAFLPFKSVGLEDMVSFKEVGQNWKIGGNAYVDSSKDQTIVATEGIGVLINQPSEESKDNLYTSFEHGDIELEVDVMMPKNSNSGLYFQGRYEIQLFDSWHVKEPQHSDMGGIYQRWDKTKEKGKEGYEGHSPLINASKSPGLWQRYRIIFHAPKFDDTGIKITNAEFKKVWLNGVLIHENVTVSGPTRAAAFIDEKSMGPFMIQGDHGPVAIKDLKYKLYSEVGISFSNMKMKEYKNDSITIPNLDSLQLIREITTDSISAAMAEGDKVTRILDYQGKLVIPKTGDYIFDFRVNQGGGLLIVDNDTLVNRDGNFLIDASGLGKISLTKGEVPFRLIYNKHNPWVIGFSLDVEGPNLQKQPLNAPSSIDLESGSPDKKIMVAVHDEVALQRGFLMHNGEKRTHCISVGTPQKINYSYDLSFGSLLSVWSGDFLDATQMWHARGQQQLGEPAGFTVAFHGDPEFAQLDTKEADWPQDVSENFNRKSLGYELDAQGIPSFSSELNNTTITDRIAPDNSGRSLIRAIVANGNQEIWHKVASGESIEKLPDGSYIINNESYFINFSEGNLPPSVRKSHGMEDLLVKIPPGEQKIKYRITW